MVKLEKLKSTPASVFPGAHGVLVTCALCPTKKNAIFIKARRLIANQSQLWNSFLLGWGPVELFSIKCSREPLPTAST